MELYDVTVAWSFNGNRVYSILSLILKGTLWEIIFFLWSSLFQHMCVFFNSTCHT